VRYNQTLLNRILALVGDFTLRFNNPETGPYASTKETAREFLSTDISLFQEELIIWLKYQRRNLN
jgi:hypothetical protein